MQFIWKITLKQIIEVNTIQNLNFNSHIQRSICTKKNNEKITSCPVIHRRNLIQLHHKLCLCQFLFSYHNFYCISLSLRNERSYEKWLYCLGSAGPVQIFSVFNRKNRPQSFIFANLKSCISFKSVKSLCLTPNHFIFSVLKFLELYVISSDPYKNVKKVSNIYGLE